MKKVSGRKLQPPTAKGKKYSIVTPTGKRVNFGAAGAKIGKPGGKKWESYCARSKGLIQEKGYDCSGKDKYKPACLSYKNWRC